MSCDIRYFELMNRAIDGELSEEERAELETHLAGCGECGSLYGALRQMAEEAAALEEDVPEGLASRIMDAVKDDQKRAAKRITRPATIVRWAVSMTTAAAVLVTVIFAARVAFTGAGSAAPESAMMNGAGDSFDTIAGSDEDAYSYDDGAYTGNGELGMENEQAEAVPAPSAAPATAEEESVDVSMPAGGKVVLRFDLASEYDMLENEYRYVLVFYEMPEELTAFSYWWQEEDGSIRRTVPNELAEKLLPKSTENYEFENDIEQSLVIVFE